MPENLPDITPNEPVVVPAKDEKIYSKLWLRKLTIEATDPKNKPNVYMEFVPYDGQLEVLDAPVRNNFIPDVFAVSAVDPQFAQIMGGVIAMCDKYKDIDFSKPFTVDPVTFAVTQP